MPPKKGYQIEHQGIPFRLRWDKPRQVFVIEYNDHANKWFYLSELPAPNPANPDQTRLDFENYAYRVAPLIVHKYQTLGGN